LDALCGYRHVTDVLHTHRNLLNRRQGEPQSQSGGNEEEDKNTFLFLESLCNSSVSWHCLRCPVPYAYVLQGIHISRWLQASDNCEDKGQWSVFHL